MKRTSKFAKSNTSRISSISPFSRAMLIFVSHGRPRGEERVPGCEPATCPMTNVSRLRHPCTLRACFASWRRSEYRPAPFARAMLVLSPAQRGCCRHGRGLVCAPLPPADQRAAPFSGASLVARPDAPRRSPRSCSAERVRHRAASEGAHERRAVTGHGTAYGLQADHGCGEDLAPAQGRKSVAESCCRRHLQKRRRGDRHAKTKRRLSPSSPRFAHSSPGALGGEERAQVVSVVRSCGRIKHRVLGTLASSNRPRSGTCLKACGLSG